MTEPRSETTDELEQLMESKVMSFLGAHRDGLRDHLSTVENLSNLYATISEEERKQFYKLLLNAYEHEPFTGNRFSNYSASVPAVVLCAIATFGPVAEFFPRMFDHLLNLRPEGIEEWANAVFPVFQYNLFHSSGRFDDATLDLIGGFRLRLSKLGGQGQAFPLRLIEVANDLERVVADIKLKKLEKATIGSDTPGEKSLRKRKAESVPLGTLVPVSGGSPAWSEIKKEFNISKSAFGKKISFVSDSFKRDVIFRDIEHAYLLSKHGYSKPAVILAGGVIEELLRLYLEHKGLTPANKSLDSYIKTCQAQGIIKGPVPPLADAVRQFRNMVHLQREISRKDSISQATAKAAVSSVFMIASELAP